ncbi:MAG: AlkZ family DNA glycosylase, partial [Anaerolineae bacterium]|nr:AlkZ family DNA glycosylase [Anaerolineae bacterium]
VQAQDYAGAKWAVGQRTREANEASLDEAFNEGRILRTHVLRPTWHFVAPADIRWLLALTAPRVNGVNGTMYRQCELDEALFARSNKAIAEALVGGRFLTRTELGTVLERHGLKAKGVRLAYIIMRAELDAVVCSGPRRGKQFTYALLDERAPQAKSLPYDEALAELTRRYFTGHGPATVDDFAWWSGLNKTQCRAGLDMVGNSLGQETVDDQTYWLAPDRPLVKEPSPTAHLLPNFDEYLLSYRETHPFLDPAHVHLIETRNPIFGHSLVIDGRMVGTWRRDFQKNTVIITLRRFAALSENHEEAIHIAAERFGQFVGMGVELRSDVELS